jgi:hypothetical protein
MGFSPHLDLRAAPPTGPFFLDSSAFGNYGITVPIYVLLRQGYSGREADVLIQIKEPG